MGGIEGVGGARRAAWEDEYEKPLPKERQRQAEATANAPWIDHSAQYSPEMFSNPAMRGPGVQFAPAAPLAASSRADDDLAASTDAFKGIELALTARRPPSERTDTKRSIDCGAYKLFPNVKPGADGRDALVYWSAVNKTTKREDFIVGPGSLAAFTADPKAYADVALRVFANGEPDAVTLESMKAVDLAIKDGPLAAIRQLGRAWKEALTNPDWVARRVTDLATAGVAASKAPAAARAAGAEAEAAATQGTGGSVGSARRYNYEASPKHGAEKAGNVSAAPRNGQAALDHSVQVKETSPRRVGVDYDTGELSVFDETHPGEGVFHGHVRTWDEMTDQQRNAFTRAGLTDRRGRILGGQP